MKMTKNMGGHEISAKESKDMLVKVAIDSELIEGQMDNSLLKKMGVLVEKYPSKAISVIREWMNAKS